MTTQPQLSIVPAGLPSRAAAAMTAAETARRATTDAVLYALAYARECADILSATATLDNLPPTVADTLPRLVKDMIVAVERMEMATKNGRVR